MASLFPLPVLLEILVNGSWVDITSYLYFREPVTITGGKSESVTDTATPATMTCTLNNRDGRFSPLYTGGAYYPYLNRNTQIRLSIVNATSSSGNTYTGYRFWGKVTDWPPLSDISGRDVYVTIAPAGPLRQINQGGGKGSSLTRYYQLLTGLQAPIAYWPCEEETGADQIGAGIDGGSNMTILSGNPVFKAVSSFNGSDPIAVVNGSVWQGVTGSFGSTGDDVFSAAGTSSWIASTTTGTWKIWGAGGGGGNGGEGSGGGGGGYATGTFTTTPGNSYSLFVAPGGSGGAGSPSALNAGQGGGTSTFTDDLATHSAPGGAGGSGTGGAGGVGGTHTGGAGGTQLVPGGEAGGGGGGSAGTAVNGNAGSNSIGFNPAGGAGGAAVTGGGAGGNGANAPTGGPGQGSSPGGGGGGGPLNFNTGYNRAGAAGAPGKVELTYTSSGGGTLPSNNVVRFILYVPAHGGNNGKVICRAATGGGTGATIVQLDCLYVTGGNIQMKGYTTGPSLAFTTSNLHIGDAQTAMVSMEMANSGANVVCTLAAIIPGANVILGSVTHTQTTATCGNVSTVTVAPNGDITKSAVGHVSVQYALVPLWQVSRALHGHHTEVGIDRLIRLAGEQAMSNFIEYSEGADHWGFESGTQSWTASNGALTQSAFTLSPNLWPTEGTHSLLMTANGVGQPVATAPLGTSGQPVQPGDIVSVAIDLMTTTAAGLPNAFVGIKFYTAAGASISASNSSDVPIAQNTPMTLGWAAPAPATAAFFAVAFGDHSTDVNGTTIYADNVRISPQMSKQETLAYRDLLNEIITAEQGMLKEAKILWGLGYRTRIALINQSPAVTLNYTTGTVSPPFAPVIDIQNVKNDITVKRKKGSKVNISLNDGSTMSVSEPPAGVGRFKRQLDAAVAADEQLLALAAHLLGLGTATNERYPTITVELTRAGIKNNAVAPLMSAVAGVDIGDYVQVTSVPFWFPSTTVKQLVIGYTETIDLDEHRWIITWNCVPEVPWEITAASLRRW